MRDARGLDGESAAVSFRMARVPGSDARPYEVRIEGVAKGRFEDLRDAISSARIAKRDRPASGITVVDRGTGQLVIEVEL